VKQEVKITTASGNTLTLAAAESNTTDEGNVEVTATFNGEASDWDETAETSAINKIAGELNIDPSRVTVTAIFTGSIVVQFVIDNRTPAPPPPPVVVMTPTPSSGDSVAVWLVILVVAVAVFVAANVFIIGKWVLRRREVKVSPLPVDVEMSARSGSARSSVQPSSDKCIVLQPCSPKSALYAEEFSDLEIGMPEQIPPLPPVEPEDMPGQVRSSPTLAEP